MRRGQTPAFIEENGEVVGINLSSDFCSEHEWGIKGLRYMFGINFENGLGFEKCIATKFPINNIVVKEGTYDKAPAMILLCVNYCSDRYNEVSLRDCIARCNLNTWGDMTLTAAWDESSFGILARGKENIAKLKAIYQMILDEDLAIGFSKKQFIENPGLLIRRKSKVSADEIQMLKDEDLAKRQLIKDAEKTKVEAKLRKAGKQWFALSPRYASPEEAKQTKYKVVFWLNPYHQSTDNYGWFTVEELLQWIDGEGPIPMKKGGTK